MFGAEDQTGPAINDAWVHTWWPLIALALGVLIIVGGGILFSS